MSTMQVGDRVRVYRANGGFWTGIIREITKRRRLFVVELFKTPWGRISAAFEAELLEPAEPEPTPAMRSQVDVMRANMRVARREGDKRLAPGTWRIETPLGQMGVESCLRDLPGNEDGAKWDRR